MRRTILPPIGTVFMLSYGFPVAAASPHDYPDRPIRVLATQPGGAGDFVARLLGPVIGDSLGEPMVIDNRPGGFTSGSITARSAADGYTLMVSGSNLWLQPLLRKNVPFDPVKDFSPITLLTTSPLVMVVNRSVPVASVKELIALARAKPGVLNYGSGNTGSSSHLGSEMLRSMTGINVVRVAFKGVGPALISLVTGEVQFMVASTGSSLPHVKAGKLKALAITSAKPSALVPGLPTIAASGVPGYEFAQTLGALAPAKTPPSIIERLNHELVRALNDADIKDKLLSAGMEAAPTTPQELGAMIKSDIVRLGKVIRNAGIREE